MAKKQVVDWPDWLRHELENWARWCWRGAYPHPLPKTHCSSIEWQYERVREDGEIESVDDKPIPVNEVNAQIVHSVYESLPRDQALVLRAEYPQRRTTARNRLRVRMGKMIYDLALNAALMKVMVAFERRCA